VNAFPLLSLFAFLLLVLLLPMLFGELMATSLVKLHLSPEATLLLMMAMIVGGLVNIPVKRIAHERMVPVHPLAIYGLGGLWPAMRRERRETILVAVASRRASRSTNCRGSWRRARRCSWPCSSQALSILRCATFLARPVQGVGILLPGLVPAAVAAILALIFAPGEAAPVAYIAGVAGPLIGADLFHLKEIEQSTVGMASIGGAGTFDGIVLSGIVAAYLA
jgi:uncharacterized membrane protein